MSKLDDATYDDLVTRLETLKQTRDQAAGAEAELMKQLKEEGLDTLDAARAEIDRIDRVVAKKEKEAAAELDRLEKELAGHEHPDR